MSAASCCAATSSGSAAALASAVAGVHAGDPAVELDLREAGLGGRVVLRRLGQDLAVRRLGLVQVAGHQRVVGRVQPRVLGGGDLDAAGLEHRVDVLPDLGLGQHAGEALDELAADHRDHHRDALHAQRLGEPRVGVHVDLAEHPAAAALGRQLFQHRRELLARLAPVGPEVQDHRRGHGHARGRSVWKFASVTSMTAAAHRRAGARRGARAAARPGGGRRGAAGWAGAGRSALRSTAPRVKIDGVVRGSLMVT